MEENYIEVELDRNLLKQFGYDFKYPVDDIWFNSPGNKIIYFKKNGQDVNSIDIPSTYEYNGKKYKITQIADRTFAYNTALTSVTIPDSVTNTFK